MAIENATPTPQPLTPSDDAKQDFERVSQALHDGGAREAYKVLKEEMDKTKDLSPQERNEWQKEMTSQLTQGHNGADPILPRLSLAYVEGNKSAFRNSSHGRVVDLDRVEQRKVMNELGLQVEQLATDGRDVVNDVEAALLSGLNQVEDTTIRAGMSGEHGGFGFGTIDQILDKDEKDAKDASSLEVSDRKENVVAKELLANDGALFEMVDSQFGSQEADGKITDREIRDMLKTLEKNPSIKERFGPEELVALENLQGIFKDANNTDHGERQGSIVKHDSLGQFFRNFSFDTAAADRYFVTRDSLASGADPNAVEVAGTVAAGAVGGAIGMGIAAAAEVAARTANNADGQGGVSGPENAEAATENPNAAPVQAADGSSNGAARAGTEVVDQAMPVEEGQLVNNDYAPATTGPDAAADNRHPVVYNADGTEAPVNDLLRINAGDGYWRIARRLVNYAGGDISNTRVAQLTQALQEANGNKLLHPDQSLYELLQNEKVSSLLNS